MRLFLGRVLGLLSVVVVAAACSSGGQGSKADPAYLAEVHGAATDIGTYRSDSQLVELGHAVCDDFRAGASYEAVADRLTTAAGSRTVPTADLGAVITAAADNYCPQYRSKVS